MIIVLACLIFLSVPGCHHAPAPPADLSRDWGQQKTFDYNGIKINYYDAGQGPPLLLLHGFAACAYTWRFIGPPLAAEHRVITMDLKGHGLSDKPRDGRYALNDQAEIVAEFIRRQDLRDLVLIGESMGGAVSLFTYFRLGEDNPERIKKLVLIDSPGYQQKLPWFVWLSQFPGVSALAELVSPRFAAAIVLRKCYYNVDKITAEQIDTYAYFGSLPGASEAVMETAKQIVPPDIEALTEKYRTVKVPVLLIWGEEDQVIPLKEVGRKFARDIPGAKLVVLPRCGHVPPEEEPLATRQAIENFLKK